jgi:hypothetical protein
LPHVADKPPSSGLLGVVRFLSYKDNRVIDSNGNDPEADKGKAIGSIEFRFSAGLKPWELDPEEYYTSVEGRIVVSVDDADDPDRTETVGELRLVVVKMAEAINDRVSLHEVFDAYSADLEAINCALFNKNGDFEERLRIECAPCDIVFVESLKLKPKYRETAIFFQVFEAAIATFATQGLIVAYMSTLDLGDYVWTRCGFEQVAGTSIVFRDNLKVDRDRKAY